MIKSNYLAALAAAVLLSSGAAFAETAQTVDVVMSNYAFSPASLHFVAGQTYRLHLINNSGRDHSFEAKDLFAAVDVAAPDRGKIDVDGNVEVGDGTTVDLDFMARKPGRYAFECAHFLHATFGMHGTATIDAQ